MRILVYEPWCKKLRHLEFNTSFLKIISKVYENDEIIYYGDIEQIKLMKKRVQLKNVQYKEIKIENEDKKIKFIFRSFYNFIKIKIENTNIDYFFLTNSPSIILIFAKLILTKINSIYILHGSLEEFLRTKKIYELGFYNKISLEFKNKKNMKYLLLGENIKEKLLEFVPKIKKNIIVVDHPYEFNKIKRADILKKEIKISTVGNASLNKGSDKIFFLENLFKKNSIKNIKLSHIGSFKNIPIPEKSEINGIGNNSLTREEYDRKLLEKDYILFFYPKTTYQLTASGAIFDALKYNKPIIALKNPYFEYIFDKMGKIGYLCDSLEELSNTLINLSQNFEIDKEKSSKEYLIMVKTIEKNREIFETDFLANKIKKEKTWDFIC